MSHFHRQTRVGAIAAMALLGACGKPAPTPPAPVAAQPPATASAAAPAADPEASLAACSDFGGDPAQRTAACTAVIESASATTIQRERALNNRGVQSLGQNDDGAMADFNAAIQLDPTYAAAFYNRAQAWRRKGDAARADADKAEAVRLDPHLAGH